MVVIKRMFDEIPILQNHVSLFKSDHLSMGWTDESIKAASYVDALQYQADLDKLLIMIQKMMSRESFSLYFLYDYLKLMIQTNRSEESADIKDSKNYNAVYCMTVHKAKGLEFDTVFIPYTNSSFFRSSESEILVSRDGSKIGWKHTEGKDHFENVQYRSILASERSRIVQEETRILYVAMTRAKIDLHVYVEHQYKNNSWAELLVMGEDCL